MDAIKFLLQEHRKIRKTLVKINKTRTSKKKKMFDLLCKDLVRHETMEETIWYPYLKKNTKLKNRIKLPIKEEHSAAKAIKKIKKVKDQEKWEKDFLSFKKAVFKHAKDEETKLFPYAKKALETEELNKIGKKFKTYKNKHAHHFL